MPHPHPSDEPLPVFFHLLAEAAAAVEAVDNFDVHSATPENRQTWRRLAAAECTAVNALLDHLRAHEPAIRQRLQIRQYPET